jgi:hypothetical protein
MMIHTISTICKTLRKHLVIQILLMLSQKNKIEFMTIIQILFVMQSRVKTTLTTLMD